MSRKEAPRAGLVKAALAGQISNAQLHGLRGRASPPALEVEVRDRVLELIQTTYRELNDSHCTEKLREVEGLAPSRSTLRRLRRGLGLPPKRRRRHRTRPRHPALGALVLVDGSVFDSLGPGTPLFLLGAIDDATGTVLALHFRPAEDLHGYLTLLRRLAEAYGLPVTLYCGFRSIVISRIGAS